MRVSAENGNFLASCTQVEPLVFVCARAHMYIHVYNT